MLLQRGGCKRCPHTRTPISRSIVGQAAGEDRAMAYSHPSADSGSLHHAIPDSWTLWPAWIAVLRNL